MAAARKAAGCRRVSRKVTTYIAQPERAQNGISVRL
jgi:hypothetical protein